MDFSNPINPSDRGLGPTNIALTWVFTSMAAIVVAMRFYVRKRFAGSWAIDDWVMLAALAWQIVYGAINTLACQAGLGKTFVNLTLEEYNELDKWSFWALPPSHIVSVLARISIAIVLIRIFAAGRAWFKWLLVGFTTFLSLFAVVAIILLFVQITPAEANWDAAVPGQRTMPVEVQRNYAETMQCQY
jgi:hypothetical protein